MADEVDVANDHTEQELKLRIAAARGYVDDQGDPKQSATDCVECGLEIPSARQIALPGIDTCVHCASAAERKRELFK